MIATAFLNLDSTENLVNRAMHSVTISRDLDTPAIHSPSPDAISSLRETLKKLHSYTYKSKNENKRLQSDLLKLAATNIDLNSNEASQIYKDVKDASVMLEGMVVYVEKNYLTAAKKASWLGEYQKDVVTAYSKYFFSLRKNAELTSAIAAIYKQHITSDETTQNSNSFIPTSKMMNQFIEASNITIDRAAKGKTIEFI